MSLIPDISPGFRQRFDEARGDSGGVIYKDLSNITTPPAHWFDASTINRKDGAAQDYLTLRAGSFITNWEDRGTGLDDAVQATEAKQPAIEVSGNRWAKYTNNGHDLLSTFADLTQPNTIVVLYKTDTVATNDSIYDGTGVKRHAFFMAGANMTLYAGTSVDSGVPRDTVTHCNIIGWNGASTTFHEDGNVTAVGNPNTQALNSLHIGAGSTGTGAFIGHIIEIAVIVGTLTDADRELIEGYFAWKLNDQYSDSTVVDALPADHTYKAAAPTE